MKLVHLFQRRLSQLMKTNESSINKQLNPKRLKAEGNMGFEEFTDLIKKVLDASWGKDWGTFKEEESSGNDPENLETPIITYEIREMVPLVATDKYRHREYGPAIYGDAYDGYDIRGKDIETIFMFQAWEDNNSKATKLAIDFIDLMDEFQGLFKKRGLKHISWMSYKTRGPETKIKDNISSRTMYYRVIFERIKAVPVDRIKKIEAIIGQAELYEGKEDGVIKFELEENRGGNKNE